MCQCDLETADPSPFQHGVKTDKITGGATSYTPTFPPERPFNLSNHVV